MNITQSLQKWGNGTGVRLPQGVVKAANLQLNQRLDVSVKGRSIILTPVESENDFTLAAMLRGVTPDHVEGEMKWGEDIGAEAIDR
jgi:antitoxin MazE